MAERYANRCAQCFQGLTTKGMEIDHEIALINGGQHRETNLVALCKVCHKHKTRLDVLAKKRIAAARKRSLGIKKPSRLAQQWTWKKRILAERKEEDE